MDGWILGQLLGRKLLRRMKLGNACVHTYGGSDNLRVVSSRLVIQNVYMWSMTGRWVGRFVMMDMDETDAISTTRPNPV